MSSAFSHFSDLMKAMHRLLLAVPAIIYGVCAATILPAHADYIDDALKDARRFGQNGSHWANCLIKVRGIEYFHGLCLSMSSGSVNGKYMQSGVTGLVAFPDRKTIEATIVMPDSGSKNGTVYWTGPGGGKKSVELGPAHSEGACWRVGDSKGKDETRLCAWSSLAVDEPTPDDPPGDEHNYVRDGVRVGMFVAIKSRTGLDTNHARIITVKSRASAILVCRSDQDFTNECIEENSIGRPPILTANCLTGTFADALPPGCAHCVVRPQTLRFLGKNPDGDKSVDGDERPEFVIQDLRPDGMGLLDGSFASSYDFALQTYGLLCPKTLEKARAGGGPANGSSIQPKRTDDLGLRHD